jgi:exodeoxyribonuclease V alpha subunit
MTTVSGCVDRIVFHNPETGYLVARFQLADTDAGQPVTTIVGSMPTIRAGEMLRLSGEWQTHPVHGRNFRVEQFELEMPDDADGIERFLASGVIQGIGPVTAGRIVERFGLATMDVIDQHPERLRDVTGISAKRLDIIQASWDEQKKVRELMMFLQSHGISVGLASRIYATYRDDAVQVITTDPYQLAHEIHGIGFRTADAVAASLGISKRSLSRYVAGLKYALSVATEDGHVFLTRADLLARATKLLKVPIEELEPALLEVLRRGDAVVDGDDIYLTPFYRAEAGTARLIERIRSTPSQLSLDRSFDPSAAVAEAGERQGLRLAEKQVLAAEQALREKVSILTGGPGTGKTSTLRTIISALDAANVSYCLCAPTGRAAKRVAETSGRAASTLHRLLEYQPASAVFNYDLSNPLPYDFIIVDEVSMLDTLLFYHLLKAIPPESQLLLVGDVDQLPAVGPGNVLRDMIASDVIPTVTLTELFRQARGSRIVVAAHELNDGEIPQIGNGPDDDLFFLRTEEPEQMVRAIRVLLRDRIPARYGLDPVDDVQVISPMHAGAVGVTALNTDIQSLLNPARPGIPELLRGDRLYREGDKVMQIRNNYEKDVFNGDVGKIIELDPAEHRVVVAFPGAAGPSEVEYERQDIDQLVLAYAVSVHKAQGSEFPAVVMPLTTRHHILLQRNLVYTAITRARLLCVLVGSEKALAIAVKTDHRQRRNTALARRITNPHSAVIQLELE